MTDELKSKVLKMEDWRHEKDIELVKITSSLEQVEKDIRVGLGRVEAKIDSFQTGVSKALWIIISVILVSIATFIIKGGLNIAA